MNDFWCLFLSLLAVQAGIMVVTWAFARVHNNFSVIDVVWPFSFLIHATAFCTLGDGWGPRRVLIFVTAALWALRLGSYMARRTYSRHPAEDPRYRELRAEYGAHINLRFFLFYQVQTLIISVMTTVYLVPVLNPTPEFHFLEIVGVAIWFLAWIGQAVADSQKGRFRKNPENNQKICQEGLWRYSRHPNYFFEGVMWIASFIIALASGGWFTILSPLIILLLLIKVSGIPITERYELKRFGDKFIAYQKSTSAFVPWWPK